MGFAGLLNDYVFIFVILIGITLWRGFYLGIKNGGWNRHLVYMWTLLVYLQYILLSPVYFYLIPKKYLNGTDILGYYGVGFFFGWIAVVCFIIGYWIDNRRTIQWSQPSSRDLPKGERIISILFYSIYALILVNMAIGGIDIQNVFIGSEEVGLGARGASYFLQNFTDSLISLIIIAYLYKIPKRKLLVWIILSFFLFSLLGFRYRIMLTLFGLGFVFFNRNKFQLKQFVIGLVAGSLVFYMVMFSTANRQRLILKEYDHLVFNPVEFDYSTYFDQTRGALADIAIYKLYDNPNKDATHDYGESMFGYIFIRMLPRSIFPDKDKFYPPPQIKTTLEAYDAWWGKFTGEATLSIGGLYIGFGWPGIVFGNFIWGLLLRRYSNKVVAKDNLSLAQYIIIALVSFQWITRGYFPQVIDHFVYMMIPLFILKYLSAKTKTTNLKTARQTYQVT